MEKFLELKGGELILKIINRHFENDFGDINKGDENGNEENSSKIKKEKSS